MPWEVAEGLEQRLYQDYQNAPIPPGELVIEKAQMLVFQNLPYVYGNNDTCRKENTNHQIHVRDPYHYQQIP